MAEQAIQTQKMWQGSFETANKLEYLHQMLLIRIHNKISKSMRSIFIHILNLQQNIRLGEYITLSYSGAGFNTKILQRDPSPCLVGTNQKLVVQNGQTVVEGCP